MNQTIDIIAAQPFVDWRIWLVFLAFSFVAVVLSHYVKRGNDFWSIIAFVMGLVSVWASIGLAEFNAPVVYNTLTNATNAGNTTITLSTNQTAYFSVQSLASPWLTLIMLVWCGILILNIIYVFVEITKPGVEKAAPKPELEIAQQELGRYYE